MTPATLVRAPITAPIASPETRLVRSLTAPLDDAAVGGKAATLSRLIALEIPVPTGVVLTTAAFDGWLDAGRIGDAPVRTTIDGLIAAVPQGDVIGLHRASDAIREIVLTVALPFEVSAAIDEAAIKMLPCAPLVVRSSAVGEDGAHASFAGQLDSILHVATRDELVRAVRLCWASYWSPRVLAYRAARGAALAGMGVIVQRQVPAAIAGVLFTRDPHNPDAMAVEYVDGLADKLVSGAIDPVSVTIGRAAGARVPDERLRAAGLADLALDIERVFGTPQDIEWAIDDSGAPWIVQARPITAVAVRRDPGAEADSGAIVEGDGGVFHSFGQVGARGRWWAGTARVDLWHRSAQNCGKHLRPPNTVWSNANVSENFPEPISPLLYSIASAGYYHYFRNLGLAFGVSRRRLRAMETPLRGIIGAHGARMYYNLTNIHAVLRLAPFGEALAGAFNQFTGVSEVAPPPAGAVSWRDRRSRVGQALELLRIAAATTWQYLFIGRRIAEFERTADAFAAGTTTERLADRSLPALAADLRAFMDIRCHRWRNASLADAAAMVCYALLARATSAVGQGSLHNGLLRALPGVPSAEPARRLFALSRLVRADAALLLIFESLDATRVLHEIRTDVRHAAFRAEFDRYLDDWGFRSSSELMLTVPTFQEQPLPVIELLQQYVRSERSAPDVLMAQQARLRIADTRRLLRPLMLRAPHRALTLWVLVKWTQHAIAFRERARLKQALLYTRCRHVALAIGRRLVEAGHLPAADDIFMLRVEEIDELVTGRAMFAHGTAGLVAQRRAEHAELSAMAPPDRFACGDGEYLPVSRGRQPGRTDDTPASGGDSSPLTGMSACGGRVRARAAVLHDVREADRLSRGDILVTRQTDPGWGPIFGLVSGLVIERGGMLSHGAIIAREFGLPCVVGVAEATRRIGHGDLVSLDGDAGTCTIDERATGGGR